MRAVWAQAARVEVMRAARRAAEAKANDKPTDDEAEAAEEEDELLLAPRLRWKPSRHGTPRRAEVAPLLPNGSDTAVVLPHYGARNAARAEDGCGGGGIAR